MTTHDQQQPVRNLFRYGCGRIARNDYPNGIPDKCPACRDHPQEHGVGGVERIRTQLGFVHYSGSLDAEPRSGITTDDVAALLAEVERLQAQVAQLTTERDRMRTWAEAEQQARYQAEDQRTGERARNALLEQVAEAVRDWSYWPLDYISEEDWAHFRNLVAVLDQRTTATSQHHQEEARS